MFAPLTLSLLPRLPTALVVSFLGVVGDPNCVLWNGARPCALRLWGLFAAPHSGRPSTGKHL